MNPSVDPAPVSLGAGTKSSTAGEGHLILLVLLPSWIAVGWLVSKAQWFWTHHPDLQFGWILLLLCAFVFWEGWERRPAARLKPGILSAGLFLFAAGFLFLVQMYLAAFGLTPAGVAGLAFGVLTVVASNLLFVFGFPGLRHFAFPFLFLLIALPMPSIVHGVVVNGLQSQIAAINVELLNLSGVPAEQTGSLIRLPNGVVGIDEACSGIRSLQSTIMATLFIGYLTLRRRSLQVMLFISGIALAIVGNVIRSLYLCLTASSKGIDAVQGVHDAAGWSILLFTAAGVALIAWCLARLQRWAEAQTKEPSLGPTSPEPSRARS